ncbi:MAG: MmgE/PrpD family protein, partial [Rhodobacteraceae bacterium]|nr:MmgE/PrpD family protein [Paracoccaceae bacterium]
RHALGIAEYHGPRSPMMRCIDFPTNVKDGSGWGALCGVSAVQLARRGFTGAPAITVEDAPEFWGDLGTRWYMLEQYFKPYPVCRWAQAPIEATLSLRRSHGLTATDVRALEIETFHESVRLHVQNPQGTDAAQYSTSFPCALALVYGDVQAKHLGDDAIANPAVLRLSNATTMVENAHANAEFPLTRLARVRLQLQDGTWLQSDWHTPRWDWQDPPSDADLRAKFDGFATPVLGASKAAALAQVIATLDTRPLADLRALLGQPSS